MNVLHLLADWKWTGPAEPILDLCLELRTLGVRADLACRPAPPEATTSLPRKARERGLEPRHDFTLNPTPNVVDNLADIRKIAEACRGYDLLHVHSSHDHWIGAMGARKSRHARIVRTNERAVSTSRNLATTFLYRRWTDGYITYSQAALDADVERFHLRGWRIDPALPLERFAPREVPHEGFVVGVVARIQRHRRFVELLEGIRQTGVPGLRVVVVGRGTHREELAVAPARRLGLTNIAFLGYLGESYVETLASFDALLYLVPGSDGSCRAIREAMAMGKAVIGARRGMIPELVDDGITGLVIDDTPENIARAIERLASDRARCREMGRRGREKAVVRYGLRRQAGEVKRIYEALL